MRLACARTATAFEAVVAALPEAVRRGRGERWVEGVFGLHARHAGNAVGYDTIAAAGDHACTLHWIRNDGDVRDGDLMLVDAGVEVDSLYTADVTRTLPVNGRFSEVQRRVYQAVLDAQEAGMAAVRPAPGRNPGRAADTAAVSGSADTPLVAGQVGSAGGHRRSNCGTADAACGHPQPAGGRHGGHLRLRHGHADTAAAACWTAGSATVHCRLHVRPGAGPQGAASASTAMARPPDP